MSAFSRHDRRYVKLQDWPLTKFILSVTCEKQRKNLNVELKTKMQSEYATNSVFMATMLEEPNTKRYLHKNKIYFPEENHFIDSLVQYGGFEHTL